MKKSILLFAFILVGFSGIAQEEASAEFKAKAMEIIELTSGPQFEVTMKPLVNMIPEKNQEAFKAEIQESLTGLYAEIADLYVEFYTEEDLDAILAFYNSEVGQKMVSKLPAISEKSMQLGQTWGMKLQPIIAKYQN